jgi:MOSC domain-containing protein YiiM
MQAVGSVHAVPGQGLEGDRYWQGEGSSSQKKGPDREVTLIEAEAIEALVRDDGVPFEPLESRRNLLTRGVALNHLVGREFRVGPARLRGIRLCEPCSHLQALTRPGVREGLVHRGGLRAEVLAEGVLRVGDPVVADAGVEVDFEA